MKRRDMGNLSYALNKSLQYGKDFAVHVSSHLGPTYSSQAKSMATGHSILQRFFHIAGLSLRGGVAPPRWF